MPRPAFTLNVLLAGLLLSGAASAAGNNAGAGGCVALAQGQPGRVVLTWD